MLTGDYAKQAAKTYKTVEGKELLASVRSAIQALDIEMKKPPSMERGGRIGAICTGLEMAADRYELFGEKDRRRKR